MINFMGYNEKKLVQIIDEWERRKRDSEMLAAKEKMLTKHIITRAEAIVKLTKAVIGPNYSAEKIIDFYIEAGMLEVKEEEEKPIFEIKYPSGSGWK